MVTGITERSALSVTAEFVHVGPLRQWGRVYFTADHTMLGRLRRVHSHRDHCGT